MTTFGAIGIASTGMTVYRKWLDAVSDNLANLNTVRSTNEDAYQANAAVVDRAKASYEAALQIGRSS
jgi:flagellar basal-body rod protein FlgC